MKRSESQTEAAMQLDAHGRRIVDVVATSEEETNGQSGMPIELSVVRFNMSIWDICEPIRRFVFVSHFDGAGSGAHRADPIPTPGLSD